MEMSTKEILLTTNNLAMANSFTQVEAGFLGHSQIILENMVK